MVRSFMVPLKRIWAKPPELTFVSEPLPPEETLWIPPSRTRVREAVPPEETFIFAPEPETVFPVIAAAAETRSPPDSKVTY